MMLQTTLLEEDLEEPEVSILSVPSKCAEQAEEFVRKVCCQKCRCMVVLNSWRHVMKYVQGILYCGKESVKAFLNKAEKFVLLFVML